MEYFRWSGLYVSALRIGEGAVISTFGGVAAESYCRNKRAGYYIFINESILEKGGFMKSIVYVLVLIATVFLASCSQDVEAVFPRG